MNESPFKQAKHYHAGRQGVPVDLIGIHSTEGSELPNSAEATQDYFTTIDRAASAHVSVDQNSAAYSVHHTDTSFAAKHANNRGYHIEQCGKAGQDAAGWDDAASRATVLRAAKVCADVIRQYPNIRPVWLTADDLKAGKANGITSHANISAAWPSSGHWDPGPNYPHEKLIAAVKAELGEDTDIMTPEQAQQLTDLGRNLKNLDTTVKAADSNNAGRYNDLKARLEALEAKMGAGSGATPGTFADELAKRLQS